jgi:hypothetical protein
MIHGPLARMGPFHGAAKRQYMARVRGLGPIAYFPLDEASGTVARNLGTLGAAANGTYTGVTLGQPGIGDGRTCPSFDGTNDYVNIHSAALAAAFNGAAFTVAGWCRVSSIGVLSDGTNRYVVSSYGGAADEWNIRRYATIPNIFIARCKAGATDKSVSITIADANWHHLAMTHDKANDAFKAYLDGAQVGATQTGLGVWGGTLGVTSTCVGAYNTSAASPWSGTLAHVALFTRPLSPAQIASLAHV